MLVSCEPTQMFNDLQGLIEDGDDKKKKDSTSSDDQPSQMPVRKFYNNTFDDSLNRAIFSLIRKQEWNKNNNEFFTTEGMIKFVAFQLLDSPPDGEIDQGVKADDEFD